MKGYKNRNSNKENYKKKIIVLLIAIFILLIILNILTKLSKGEETVELSYDNLTNVKEVVEYYKSTYISEEESTEKGYKLDIYLVFCKLPYDEDDTSNEEWYNNFIEDIAKVISYKSFKMIDKENDITVKVTCSDGKIDSIIINDIEDYFIYMDSQISMKNYVEIETVEISATSSILQECLDTNWSSDIDFGTRDSIFDEYYIYFDEGIEVKSIQNQVYNIIFTKNYDGNVVENLFPGIDFKSVKNALGEPSFEDEENEIIGYKGEKMYVFFTADEISVYRVTDSDTDDFFKLADEYISGEVDFLEFMNLLTYMWPDYDEYTYSSTSVFISYPLKGIEIAINSSDTDGILVYNNIKSSLSKINRYLENTDFVARLQIDAVFLAETRRVEKENGYKTEYEEYLETLDEEEIELIGESLRYYCIPKEDESGYIYSVNFISSDGEKPNRQLNDSVSYYLWVSTNTFIYSKMGKGIYKYDLDTGVVTRLLEGTDEYKLEGYNDGILQYDGNELEIEI